MAKNKNMDSFNGFTFGANEPLPGQIDIETLEDGRYIPEQKEKPEEEKQSLEPKKKGRPKLNRETKKRFSFTLLPSVYEQASKIAYQEGKSVSELIDDFLTEYVNKNR